MRNHIAAVMMLLCMAVGTICFGEETGTGKVKIVETSWNSSWTNFTLSIVVTVNGSDITKVMSLGTGDNLQVWNSLKSLQAQALAAKANDANVVLLFQTGTVNLLGMRVL